MSRQLFSTSQKRRVDDEAHVMEPSTSRRKLGSPESMASYVTKENEFDESDESDHSDVEYEEVQLDEESDYEEGDDYRLVPGRLETCLKKTYEPGWDRSKPESVPELPKYKGTFGPKTKYATELEAFLSLITPKMIQEIVDCTNDFFKRLVKKFQDARKQVTKELHYTDSIEIKALLGLWLSLGITGFHNSSVNEIFSASKYSSLDAHLCFSRTRYEFLMRAIRFDYRSKREGPNKDPNLFNPDGTLKHKDIHIKKIHADFTKNCRACYTPSENMVVDEILVPFRGRCSFRMYIPNKKAKYGIKLYCLVDPVTKYQINSKIYTGKAQGDADHGMTVAYQLSEEHLGVGRTVVTDNYFTSPKLGKLLWDSRTYLLGTLQKKRTGNPKDFVSEKVEPVKEGYAKYVYRQQETIMKFQAKKKKQVLLYSTKHHGPETHQNGKPKMITDYNATKFGVDIFDEMSGRHAYAPPTRRWPLKVFMHMVDTAALNAYILFDGQLTRRDFIGNLADQLMQEQKDRRRQEATHWINALYIQIDDVYKSIKHKMSKKRSTEAEEMPITTLRSGTQRVTPEQLTSISLSQEISTPKMAPVRPNAFENTALAFEKVLSKPPKPSLTPARNIAFENTALAYESPPATSKHVAPPQVPPKTTPAPVQMKTKQAPAPPKTDSKTEKPKAAAPDGPSKFGNCRDCGKHGRTFCKNCVPPQPYCRIHMTNHVCKYTM